MEGIRILNSYEHFYGETKFGLCMVICIFAIIVLFLLMLDNDFKTSIIALVVAIISGFGAYAHYDDYITRYEAIIDDDTSYVGITERYNIVEQRGDIFVLEEKSD